MAMSNTEITESFFQSMEIIVDEKLKHIECDVTDVCIIVDDSDAKNGNYMVSTNNGATKYTAVSESKDYKKDEKVRVSIPNGDYTGYKYIVGKCVEDNAITPITYVSPLETVVEVTENLISNSKSAAQYGLIANGTKKEIPVWSVDLSTNKNYQDLQATGIYNTIALSAQFRTVLGEYQMRSGTYGLRLDVYIKLHSTSDKYIVRSVYLDSSEMFGDPYNFVLYSPQSKKFDLSKLGTVDKMSLWFYQDSNFTYFNPHSRQTVRVPFAFETVDGKTTDFKDNILLKNVYVSFGSDLSVIEDNTIQGYSLDSRDYRYIVTEADNQKRIGFLWYNKNENNQYLGFSDGIVDFVMDGDKPETVTKKDKSWKNITTDVLDSNKKPIEEFKKENNSVVLQPILNTNNRSKDNKLTTSYIEIRGSTTVGSEYNKINAEIRALAQEIEELKEQVQQDFDDKIILSTERDGLLADIDGTGSSTIKSYYEVYNNYLTSYKERFAEFIRLLRIWEATDPEKRGPYPKEPDPIVRQTYVRQIKQKNVKIQKVSQYDELEYLKESETDSRLIAQMGKEGVPQSKDYLKMSADLEQAKPILTKTFNLVTKDLVTALRTFDQRTAAIDCNFKQTLTTILTTAEKDSNKTPYSDSQTINVWYIKTKKILDALYSICEQFLNLHYRNQENLKLLEKDRKTITFLDDDVALYNWYNKKDYEEIKFKEKKCNVYDLLITNFEKLDTMIKNMLTSAKNEIKNSYSGYQGIYDTYNAKIIKILDEIKSNIDDSVAEELFSDIYTVLKTLDINSLPSAYPDYNKRDFSHCDNRYSIYWYRYEPGYKDDNDRLIKVDWKRLTTEDDFGIKKDSTVEVKNFGLPIYDDFIERDGIYYFNSKIVNTCNLVERLMDGNRVEEKYKVILFYNHEMYESDEIDFKNLDDIPDPATADKTDAIVIKHGENSQDTYQKYALNNFLDNMADASKSRTISVHYEGLTKGDEVLAEAQVYWYIPNSATMLTCDDEHLTKTLGFSSDKDIEQSKKPDYSRDGYICYYKKIGTEEVNIEDDPETEEKEEGKKTTAKASDLDFVYKIKDYYIATSSRNSIVCKVIKDEYTFETELPLTFTSLGSSGTDYTLAITPETTQIMVKKNKPLPLKVELFDYNNEQLSISKTLLAEEGNGGSNFKIEWEGPTSYAYDDETKAGENGNIAVVDVFLSGDPDPEYPNGGLFGIMKASVDCPIEYEVQTDEDEDEDADTGSEETKKTRTVGLVSYYSIPYSVGDYYIEGATAIIYDSMGTNPAYYKDPYKIFKTNTNEDLSTIKIIGSDGKPTKKNKYNIIWRTAYYKKNSKDSSLEVLSQDIHSDYNICRNYLPTMDSKNSLIASQMFIDGCDCWCAVECWVKDLEVEGASHVLTWVQPLVIIQNRYPSPMLNAWDGSFSIDKKNGTIMSSMLGAGRKNSTNNTFEGVLMGDVEGAAGIYSDDNKSGLGIYGFSDGAQSFGFNIDGTAFIGKAGRGRIEFNGNTGVIKSAAYTAEKDKPSFGMLIDMDDGFIDMRGGTEYTEDDWRKTISDKFSAILNKKTISKKKIPENLQDAILKRIKSDLKNNTNVNTLNLNLATVYSKKLQDAEEAVAIATENIEKAGDKKEKEKAEKIKKEKEALREIWSKRYSKANLRLSELDAINNGKYYALSTLRYLRYGSVKLEYKEINSITGKEEDVQHKLTKKEYNIILKYIDEFITCETYDGKFAMNETGDGVDSYKDKYGKIQLSLLEVDEDGNPLVTHQSHVRLDVASPYFSVTSEQGKRLINISDIRDGNVDWSSYKSSWEPDGHNLNKGYYLKSNNFAPVDYDADVRKDGGQPTLGSGFLLDLNTGHINSYNLSIFSKYIYINGNIDGDKNKGSFFILKDDDGCNLIEAASGGSKFYIQSHDYSAITRHNKLVKEGKEEGPEKPMKGVKFDLAKSKLDAYDFTIKGRAPDSIEKSDGTIVKNAYGGSYILLSSDPEFTVYLKETDNDNNILSNVKLMEITPTVFQLRSKEWSKRVSTVISTKKNGSAKTKTSADPITTRMGPGIDFAKAKDIDGDKSVTLYAMQEGKDTSSDKKGTWYRIGTSRWIHSSHLVEIVKPETTTKTEDKNQGLVIDMNSGTIKATKTGKSLYIDSEAATYPIQLGTSNDYNLKLGWDGSLQGGSLYDWSINESGVATFNYLIANGGSLDTCTIGNATITNADIQKGTITDASMGGGSLTSADLVSCSIQNCHVVNSLTFGSGIGGTEGAEDSDGFACKVDTLDASVVLYEFTTESVVTHINYTTWNFLGLDSWPIVGTISATKKNVLASVTPKKVTRKYQVVRADTIESEEKDGTTVGGEKDETNGSSGAPSGWGSPDLGDLLKGS